MKSDAYYMHGWTRREIHKIRKKIHQKFSRARRLFPLGIENFQVSWPACLRLCIDVIQNGSLVECLSWFWNHCNMLHYKTLQTLDGLNIFSTDYCWKRTKSACQWRSKFERNNFKTLFFEIFSCVMSSRKLIFSVEMLRDDRQRENAMERLVKSFHNICSKC